MKTILFITSLCLLTCFLPNKGLAQKSNENCLSRDSFKAFWTEFRETVIKNDTVKLATIIHFPLKIRRERDEDSIIYLQANNFIIYYKKFLLNNSFYIKDERVTNLEYIKNVEMPEKATLYQETETWKRVGDLEFEKINSKWGLVLLYIPR